MSTPFPSESESYQQLRSWYLARLRKSALTDAAKSSLTPASLIQRDRAALEKLIASSAHRIDAREQPAESKVGDLAKFAGQHAYVLGAILFIVLADLAGIALLASGAWHKSMEAPGPVLVMAILFACSAVAITLFFAFYQLWAKLSAVIRHEQDIADYALDAFWSFDDKLTFAAASPATTRLWGHDAVVLAGTDLKLLVVQEFDLVQRQFLAAKESKFPKMIQCQIMRLDGTTADIEITAEYSGSAAGYFCVVADVTERRNLERYRQQVMQMLSHDLKSPLTALQFSLALIGKGKYGALTAEGSKMVELGEKNSQRLISLLDQLLDLQKVEARRLDLDLVECRIAVILNEAIESISQFAQEKEIGIDFEPAANISLPADKDRLVQVFVNLLSNAIKYSPAGSKIQVTARVLPGDFLVEARISDQGPGIARQYQSSIFDQFFRVPSDESQKATGTGLGLAICKAIVEAHGGKIGLDCEPGKGTSFWCRLPARKLDDHG